MSVSINAVTKKKNTRSSMLLKNTKPIQNIIRKTHKLKVPFDKILVSQNSDIFTSDYFKKANFDDCTYIAQLRSDHITFYRTIYQHSNPTSIQTTVKNESFEKHREKIIKILSYFYNDINIVCITSCNIKSNLNNIIYNFINPDIFLLDHYVKIIANNPRHEKINNLPNFMRNGEINFMHTCILQQADETNFENFLNKVNDCFIPEELDIKLDKDMSLDELNDNLSIIDMYMI
jgi:hypothetical protein